MTNKPSDIHFQIIRSNLDSLYMRLVLSTDKIIKMVEHENDSKGFYNAKKYKIIECDNISEFEKFQSTIKGLNNYIYYNSLILSSYSVFEHSLKLICNFINDHFALSEKFIDNHRDILGNSINYIKRTQFVDFNEKEIDRNYMHIKNVNKLRNLIAHHNGNLFKDKSKSLENQPNYNLYKSDKRLIIISNGQLYIDDSDYISSFVEKSEIFLSLIVEKLKNKC